MQAPMQKDGLPMQTPMHNGQVILTYDKTVKPYKSMILEAWLADRFKVNVTVAYANAYAETPPLPMQNEGLPMQTPMQDLPPEPTPNVEFYERLIAAKDETISELKTQVQTKDFQILELIKSKEHSDILLQTALQTPQLNAVPTVEPQRPTDAPPVRYQLAAAVIAFVALVVGLIIAKALN